MQMSLMLNETPHALDETSSVICLLNSFPDSYQVVKYSFQYTGNVQSYDLLCLALKTRELDIKKFKAKGGVRLVAKGKSGVRERKISPGT